MPVEYVDAGAARTIPVATAVSAAFASDSGRKLRVAQVVRSLETGGQEVLCARLVEHLGAYGFDSLVVSLQGGGWLANRLEQGGYPVRCLNASEGWHPGLVVRLARLFRHERVDAVHCHNGKAFLYGGLAALAAGGIPLFFTKHGVWEWDGRLTGAVGRFLLRHTRATIAVSQDIAQGLRHARTTPETRLHTVLNGVDTDEFSPQPLRDRLRLSLGIPADAPVIGTVARLSPEKDQAGLIRGFVRLCNRLPGARLVIVGDGPLRADLEAQARDEGVTDLVLFLGERQDVASALGAMDLFCLPSLTEGTSLTLLEAMATGLPVVATAVGGTPEVVLDGHSGRLVPPSDPEALAGALVEVLSDPALAQEMGRNGRETVRARYSLDGMVERYAALYHGSVR